MGCRNIISFGKKKITYYNKRQTPSKRNSIHTRTQHEKLVFCSIWKFTNHFEYDNNNCCAFKMHVIQLSNWNFGTAWKINKVHTNSNCNERACHAVCCHKFQKCLAVSKSYFSPSWLDRGHKQLHSILGFFPIFMTRYIIQTERFDYYYETAIKIRTYNVQLKQTKYKI